MAKLVSAIGVFDKEIAGEDRPFQECEKSVSGYEMLRLDGGDGGGSQWTHQTMSEMYGGYVL